MKRSSITSFFKPIAKADDNPVDGAIYDTYSELKRRKVVLATGEKRTLSPNNELVLTAEASSASLPSITDIGEVANQLFSCPAKLSNSAELRLEVLKNTFVPSQSYVFPVREINKKNLLPKPRWRIL